MQQPFIQNAYSRLSGLGVARKVLSEEQQKTVARNKTISAKARKLYAEQAKQARQRAMAKNIFEQQAERARKSDKRMKDDREFKAAQIADRMLSYRVPNTRLGRWLARWWHPLATRSGQLVWRELWCGGNYNAAFYAAQELNHKNAWA